MHKGRLFKLSLVHQACMQNYKKGQMQNNFKWKSLDRKIPALRVLLNQLTAYDEIPRHGKTPS